jgi:glycosyltransferase involved in cell wall biosynthesis
MRVIIATTSNPFVHGGASLLVEWLQTALISEGHTVEVLDFPFSTDWQCLLDQSFALRLLDVTEHGDRLIAIRPPSYLLRHPRKIVWFIHHHRAAYDLWGTEYQDIPMAPEGAGVRQALFNADRLALGEARKLFCNSRITAQRLKRYNGLDAIPLYPPVWQPERFRSGPPGDYLVCIARLTPHKRQWLAIEAMKHTRTPARLVLAGQAAPGEERYVEELRFRISRAGLTDRVTLYNQWITEEMKITLLENCLAFLYIPFNEDSYGFAALEAFHAAKPVITTSDSGGVLELVTDLCCGRVVEPEPVQIALAIDQLYTNRTAATAMGKAARARITELGISWKTVLEQLLS